MTAMAGPLRRSASISICSDSLMPGCGSNSIMDTSTSPSESLAVLSIRLPSLFLALWTPGVSSRTYCSGPRVMTPVIRVRVVCGLEVTMATFSPTSRLVRLDLPTLGRPMTATNTDEVS